mmetsp:Transcript_47236/g.101680  ORF Transcript_47236/g.101680 Transcript_47236/m.101680 type:complete len:467 (+) Transcript_47236:209-1609(+)
MAVLTPTYVANASAHLKRLTVFTGGVFQPSLAAGVRFQSSAIGVAPARVSSKKTRGNSARDVGTVTSTSCSSSSSSSSSFAGRFVPTAAAIESLEQQTPVPFPSDSGWYGERLVKDIDPALIDSFGRKHRYLRLSLTDKCNLRCQYCSPEEGEEAKMPTTDGVILTGEEISRLTRIFVGLGVRKIRLTGGEPTIRGDFGQIVRDLGALRRETPHDLSYGITTNGVRLLKYLPDLADAGLVNINLSLDTLVAAKFPLLVRREKKWHDRVMKALYQMLEEESPFKVKINCVLLRGVNEDELGQFVDLIEKYDVEVRFLEFMPFDGNAWSANRMVPQAEIVEGIQRHLASRGAPQAKRLPPDSINDVANLWGVPGFKGRIGIIASMTDAFCGGCNRLRVTAHGEMRNCLFGEEGWSLRDRLREEACDKAMAQVIAEGVKAKHAKLGGKRDMHELKERGAFALGMMSLGG